MRGEVGPHLEVQRGKLIKLAEETLKIMDTCYGLPLDDDLADMGAFLANHDTPVEPRASQDALDKIDAKVVYYARVKDAKSAGDEEELFAAKLHVDGAVIQDILASTDGGVLQISEIAVFTLDLLHRIGNVKATILRFQDPPLQAGELWPMETKAQLEAVLKQLKRKNYTRLFPKVVCGVCLEKRVDCEPCSNTDCLGQLCSDCFSRQVHRCAEEKFNDPERLARVPSPPLTRLFTHGTANL